MADIVNPQITDAVEVAPPVAAGAPAIALANLYQANAQALGIAAQDAVAAQNHANTTLQASVAQAVSLLLGSQ